MARKTDISAKLIEAALELCVREESWSSLRMSAIATEAGVGLKEAYHEVSSKQALLNRYLKRVDETVLADGMVDMGDPVKDRLFDILMRRLDAMAADKEALRVIARDSLRDPMILMCSGCKSWHSLTWMAEAAGLSTTGLTGHLRLKGLAVIWACTVREWFKDDTADMSKTMAALDRLLTRTDSAVNFLCKFQAPGLKKSPDGEADAAKA